MWWWRQDYGNVVVVVEGKPWKCGGGGIWFHYSRNCVEKKARVDVGSMCGVDVGSMWGRRVDVGL